MLGCSTGALFPLGSELQPVGEEKRGWMSGVSTSRLTTNVYCTGGRLCALGRFH